MKITTNEIVKLNLMMNDIFGGDTLYKRKDVLLHSIFSEVNISDKDVSEINQIYKSLYDNVKKYIDTFYAYEKTYFVCTNLNSGIVDNTISIEFLIGLYYTKNGNDEESEASIYLNKLAKLMELIDKSDDKEKDCFKLYLGLFMESYREVCRSFCDLCDKFIGVIYLKEECCIEDRMKRFENLKEIEF